MDEIYWKQYEADLIKTLFAKLYNGASSSSAHVMDTALHNAKFHAMRLVEDIRQHIEKKED